MLIAVDFDNTIVCYDALFHRVAREQGLIPADLPQNKTAVRDHLRATGREDRWTELQGEVYGARMPEAAPFPGAREFFLAARTAGLRLVIVSHKTRHPCRGTPHDLHAAARAWLEQNGFFAAGGIGLGRGDVFFEPTKAAKLARIAACGATHCIDDLPEILTAPDFPDGVERLLFYPYPDAPACPDLIALPGWPEIQRHLLAALSSSALTRVGLSPRGTPRFLTGGANNRAAAHPLADGRTVLVKSYAPPGPDGRDRFATERAFYAYLASAGLAGQRTPRALGWDAATRSGVFTWIDGVAPEKIADDEMAAAVDFIAALQRSRSSAGGLPAASEACFSSADHAAAIERRVAALSGLPGTEPVVAAARDFVRHELQPAWRELHRHWRAQCRDAEWDRPLSEPERCVSPSDFGFHNALRRPDGSLAFFDFEYAGWDDPAKLVADFFCQPDRPAPAGAYDCFVPAIAASLPPAARGAFVRRCDLLLPAYRVKWACILLNEFTAAGRARREFSLGRAAAQTRRPRQLARARALLGPLRLAAA